MSTWTAKNLVKLTPEKIRGELPAHLENVLKKAIELLDVSKVVLYGSRARGDARENSDFDLAFKFPNKDRWAQFSLEIQEESPSLYHYDLVDLQNINTALKEKILDEGIIIYDAKTGD